MSEAGDQSEFRTFDPAGSTGTYAEAVNAAGFVAGWHYSDTGIHGFVRNPQGEIVSFDAPGSSIGTTTANSINASGDIAGTYVTSEGNWHGFVRHRTGQFTSFDIPGLEQYAPAWVTSINTSGAVAGFYRDSSYRYHGFVRDSGGSVATFDPPGSVYTRALSINTSGETAGTSYDGYFHGFVRDPQGTITVFDMDDRPTRLVGINNAGFMTGSYEASPYQVSGFVSQPHGSRVAFDPPGSTDTEPSRINERGEVTGHYFANDIAHGFLRDSRGVIRTFDAPGASMTFPTDVTEAGLVTGRYYGTDGNNGAQAQYHGFIGRP